MKAVLTDEDPAEFEATVQGWLEQTNLITVSQTQIALQT
jgi:hypothetical protein